MQNAREEADATAVKAIMNWDMDANR